MTASSLPGSESLTAEFKTSFNVDVVQSLAAFANSKGESVYVGVSDTRKVKGVTLGPETLAGWLNEIKLKTTPQLMPEANVLEIEGRTVVRIFPDRIEFFNPGALPPQMDAKQLLSGEYVSRPPNRLVAQIFKDAGLIEKYGSGIKHIRMAFAQQGMPVPEFRCDTDSVLVRSILTPTPPIPPPISRRDEVLEWLRLNPRGSLTVLARHLGIRADTAKKHVEKLKSEGRLKREGSSRNGRWVVGSAP